MGRRHEARNVPLTAIRSKPVWWVSGSLRERQTRLKVVSQQCSLWSCFLLGSCAVLMALNAIPAVADIESMKQRAPKLAEIKDQGFIGEKPDGLVGLVKPNSEVEALVTAENDDRMEIYRERAAQGGHPLATFMKVMGEARIKNEKPNRYVMNGNGEWVRKQ